MCLSPKLTLFRIQKDTPLGRMTNFQFPNIRDATDLDAFDYIATCYGYEINYTSDIKKCDMLVYNLDRYEYYTHVNLIYFLSQNIINFINENNIPVVFWHSGECHNIVNESMYNSSTERINQQIWYIDSNNNTNNYPYHLFFENGKDLLDTRSEIIYNDEKLIKTYKNLYDFFMFTGRSDAHKHIIYNTLEKLPNTYKHYTAPDEINLDILEGKLESLLPVPMPATHAYIEYDTIREMKQRSRVHVSINTYFVGAGKEDNLYDPLYITEKVLDSMAYNKPIIPVGHHGIVKYFRELGFEFPDWIDYSYDTITNDTKRLTKIIQTINETSHLNNLELLSNDFLQNSKNRERLTKLNYKTEFNDIVNKILNNNQTLLQ